MKLVHKPETLCLVLLYCFQSINYVLCCVDSLKVFPEERYATFELPGKAGDKIQTVVILTASERLRDDQTGSLKLFEEANDAQITLEESGIIKYKIVFPLFNGLPRVVEILKHGKQVCSRSRGKYKTTITLEHIFTTEPPQIVRSTLRPTSRPTERATTPVVLDSTTETFQDQTYFIEKIPEKIPNKFDDVECGKATRDLPLVFGGKIIMRGDWPWMAALFKNEGNGRSQFLCGGTVMSRQAILTAAHCFNNTYEAGKYFVVVGRHNLNKPAEGQTLEVSDIIPHPAFKDVTKFDADIAIIKTAERYEYTQYVLPACLSLEDIAGFNDVVGVEGKVVGWGTTEKGKLSDVPLETPAPIISRETCLNRYPKLKDFSVARGFCAGKLDGTGPCTGDSGSGLLISHKGRWFLRGIVSIKIEINTCSDPAYVFYTDVPQFSTWINMNI